MDTHARYPRWVFVARLTLGIARILVFYLIRIGTMDTIRLALGEENQGDEPPDEDAVFSYRISHSAQSLSCHKGPELVLSYDYDPALQLLFPCGHMKKT